MANFENLSTKDLIKAVEENRAAVQREKEFLTRVGRQSTTLGVREMAEAAPSQLEALEKELRDLEDELAKRPDE